MASRGSVIPLFFDQIRSGKPMTITNPNMTRFMTVSYTHLYLEKTLPVLKKQLEENAVSGNIPIKSGGTGTSENNYFKYIYPIQVSNIAVSYTHLPKELFSENVAILNLVLKYNE